MSNPLTDCVAIMIDPFHKEFGNKAEVLEHRLMEGVASVRFLGSKSCAELHDGMGLKGIFPPQVVIFNAQMEASSIDALVKALPGAQRTLEEHFAVIREGRLHRMVQEAARSAIKEIVKGLCIPA